MQANPTGRSPATGQDERPDESLTAPAVNPDADEFQDGKRLKGSSSVSARDALLGGAPGPLLGDDLDSVTFPDNDPAISSTDNADASTLDDPDTGVGADIDTDPDAPFADIGGEGGGPGAGPGPA